VSPLCLDLIKTDISCLICCKFFTVPNISLYSLLVGGLPSLPSEAMEQLDTKAAIDCSKRQSIDWQLSLTATFFDHCVPNQPGFSSSVAAVTIFPGAKDITLAWRKWYAAASKLRRLRFIRRQIMAKRRFDIEVAGGDDEDEEDYFTASQLHEDEQDQNNAQESPQTGTGEAADPTPRPIYRDLAKRKSYFRKVMGSSVSNDLDSHVYENPSFGPEQAAVYAREFAQAAAPCCPNGCREGRVRQARIDDLIEMEKEATEEVHLANLELNEIRRKITFAAPMDQASSQSVGSDGTSKPKLSPSSAARLNLDLEANLYNQATSGRQAVSIDSKCDPSTLPAKTDGLSLQTGEEDDEPVVQPHIASPEWKHVQSIVNSYAVDGSKATQSERSSNLSAGTWEWPSWKSLVNSATDTVQAIKSWILSQSVHAVDSVARDTTYAVVTFTSRQAAVCFPPF